MTGEPEDNLLNEDASTDTELTAADSDDQIEVDPETERQLKEAGIELDTPASEPVETIAESETVEDSAQDDPPVEPEVEVQEEKPLILGKYKTQADLESAHLEAQNRIRKDGQMRKQFEQLQGAFNQLSQHPDGMKAITEIASGRMGQPQTPQIPQEPEAFSEWMGKNLQGNLGTFVDSRFQTRDQEVAQLRGTVNSMLAYLENQAVTQKHGDTLNELQPYMDRVTQELGPNAQYVPREQIIRMAKGDKYDDDLAQRATTEQTEEEEAKAKEQHRDEALKATVETADVATSPTGRVIDIAKLPIEEQEKALIALGATRVVR